MSGSAVKQFVDTTILVYVLDQSAGAKYERAASLVTELWEAGNGYVSIQVLQELFVTLTRKTARPLDSNEAAEIVAEFGHWGVHSPTVEDVLSAIMLQQHFGLSFWDAMILRSAEEMGCPLVWSEDLSSGQAYGFVKVQSPFST